MVNRTLPDLDRVLLKCQVEADNAFGPTVAHHCGRSFDFTLLFEQSILSIAPSVLLLLLFLLRILQLYKSSVKTLPNPVYLSKASIAVVLVASQLASLVLWTSYPLSQTPATITAATLSVIDAVAIVTLSYLEHTRSVRPSAILNVYLLVSLVFDSVQVRTLFLRHDTPPSLVVLSTTSVSAKAVLLILEAQSKRPYLKFPYRSYPPEATSGILNRSFFWWINSLFIGGFRRLLSVNDLYAPDVGLSSKPLQVRMQKAWNQNSSKGRYALLLATVSCLRRPILSVVVPRTCLIGFNYSQPFLISRLINFVGQPPTSSSDDIGYGLIAATCLIYLGIAFSTVHYKHRLFRMITMFRGALVSLIYSRTLMLQADIYNESAAVTLMSTDIDRISNSLEDIHETWARAIEVAIGIWLLERQLGWVCVAPVIVVIGATVGNLRVAKFMAGRQKAWVQAVQRRVGMTSSMLSSMKAVKMMGLSDTMSNIIHGQRVRELGLSRGYRWLIIWMNVFGNIPFILGPVTTFVAFELKARAQESDSLSTVQAFTSLAIISLLSDPAARLLVTIPSLAASMACFDRIQKYLEAQSWKDERKHIGAMQGRVPGYIALDERGTELQIMPSFSSSRIETLVVKLRQATIRPSPNSAPVLHDINFRANHSSLTLIVGPVGSGKSTLMKAILGELSCDSGEALVASKSIAYCAQTPWLLNLSVKQSVSAAADMSNVDEAWYQTVMHACDLDHDMLQLPDGDQSIIGSRGLTLSGGQKQRVALARAVYARRDVVLLDDVLSALDARTEELIVDRLLGSQGILRKIRSTVILVTHAVQPLALADNIVVIAQNGRVAEYGTFDNLRAQGGYFNSELVRRFKADEERDGQSEMFAGEKCRNAVEAPTSDDLVDLTRRTGDTSIYGYYFKSIGWRLGLSFACLTTARAFGLQFPQIWLKWWTEDDGARAIMYISVYILLAIFSIAVSGIQLMTMFIYLIPKSAAKLHWILLSTVMRAKQSFFAATDTGVILNRFSQDMTLIDGVLPTALLMVTSNLTQCIGQAALLSTGSSWMGITIPFCFVAMYLLQNVYLRTSRQLRYLDLEAKSPLYSHFLESLEGLSTIRAFGWQQEAMETNIQHLDISQRPYYLLYCIQRWLNLVLDLLVAVLGVIVVSLAVRLRHTTNGALLGIALNNILSFNMSLTNVVSSYTNLETSLGAIARIRTFAATTPEEKDKKSVVPSEIWPEIGEIVFENVTASYGPAAFALQEISFSVAPGQKVGICGRTGSGKSSLLLTLLRLLDLETGTITVGGMDLSTIPRNMIRSRMVAIPQDPFMLSGSIRLNADPSGLATDDLIIEALMKVRLWHVIQIRGGLDAELNVQPLSQGQQQLFCLARAMLKKSKILLLDEATSNVDSETDKVMQQVIREEFQSHTIITVAHRLDTIMDSDKVGVLDRGRLVEFDSPNELMSRPSIFRSLHG